MRIIQITAGTGTSYCGNCIRDNALVKGLRGRGQDAVLVPLYLPILSDDLEELTDIPLFFGGINVYLQQKSAFFRKTPRWVDRWFDLKTLLRWVAGRADMTGAQDLGQLTVSMLKGEEGKQVKEVERLVAWLKELQPRPDVVCLSNALLIGVARRIKTELKVPLICTLQGEDSFLDSLPEFERIQAWKTLAERVRDIDAFIAVSRYFAEVMKRRLDLPSSKVHAIPNGISLEGYEPASSPPDPPVLGFLSRLCADKGLGILIDAFIAVKSKDIGKTLKLQVAGGMNRGDQSFLDQLKKKLKEKGLEQDVEFSPNLTHEEKVKFLSGLTLFSVPATYGEAFGLYLLEAMASGVPVIQPNLASFPEIIQATGGGVLYESNDSHSLAEKIEYLLDRPDEARMMGERGNQAVREHFSVERMTDQAIQVFEKAIQGYSTE